MANRAQRRTPAQTARAAQIYRADPNTEKRARYSQLNYQATVFALDGTCDCACCEKTRELARMIAGEPLVEISADGQRDGS